MSNDAANQENRPKYGTALTAVKCTELSITDDTLSETWKVIWAMDFNTFLCCQVCQLVKSMLCFCTSMWLSDADVKSALLSQRSCCMFCAIIMIACNEMTKQWQQLTSLRGTWTIPSMIQATRSLPTMVSLFKAMSRLQIGCCTESKLSCLVHNIFDWLGMICNESKYSCIPQHWQVWHRTVYLSPISYCIDTPHQYCTRLLDAGNMEMMSCIDWSIINQLLWCRQAVNKILHDEGNMVMHFPHHRRLCIIVVLGRIWLFLLALCHCNVVFGPRSRTACHSSD